jgi:hypothetical protein
MECLKLHIYRHDGLCIVYLYCVVPNICVLIAEYLRFFFINACLTFLFLPRIHRDLPGQ